MAGRFARVETRRRARGFVLGLLADLPRKTCWSIAEYAGDRDSHGMQHLLGRASWDTDGVRDDLREHVTTHLGEHDAVLMVDETGDLKKGTSTVGVQRQYTGTAGRIENAQVAVYLTYSAARGHAMIDRELYLPKSWPPTPTGSPRPGCPRASSSPPSPRWPPACSPALSTRGCPHGGWPATRSTAPTRPCARSWNPVESGTCWPSAATAASTAAGRLRADEITKRLPRRAWQRLSAGAGAKGQRYYDWH